MDDPLPGPRTARFHTADDLYTINDLHFVKDQPTLIQLQAKDVLHSFFLPQFRIKQDAVPGPEDRRLVRRRPGRPVTSWPAPSLCGWGHYKMRGNVTVHATQAEFDEWVHGRSIAANKGATRSRLAAEPEGIVHDEQGA